MSFLNSLFESFVLERMRWQLSLSEDHNRDKNALYNPEISKIQDLFFNPDFVINQGNDKPSSSKEREFVQIDILKLYESCIIGKTKSEVSESSKLPTNISPRSLDYSDERLFRSPDFIYDKIVNQKKLAEKCIIYLTEGNIIFDCNYEQITLISQILENMVRMHPLVSVENQYLYSPQTVFHKLNTHSYIFSFEISNDFLCLILDIDNLGSLSNDLHSTIISLLLDKPKNLNYEEFIPFTGYHGIYVSILPIEMNNVMQLRFYVSNEFTKNSMILDRTAIFKTSLKLFDKFLLSVTNDGHSKIEVIKDFRKELANYCMIP